MTNLSKTKKDILMVGVGGQGIILASDVLSEVALAVGLDVKKTDTLGMAQRGGSVTSHLRIGGKVWSPLISPAEADVLLAFEKLEAARWVNYLKPEGLAILNNFSIPPLAISMGKQTYPTDKEIIDSFHQRTKNIHLIEGSKQAELLGDVRTLNIFMLGFLSYFLQESFKLDLWQKCIANQLPAKILDINLNSFKKGREVATSGNL
ncbi:MAG: indolepyruvate oxidoreductase subunit beta [Dehalococcoidales bacterium]|nr:indolepyruvate oxidoreductase subunit beta [Dehalococcoidales bacterium]